MKPVLSLLWMFSLIGCVPTVAPAAPALIIPEFRQPVSVFLLTPGASIEHQGGDWIIEPDTPVPPPFESRFWPALSTGVEDIINQYEQAIEAGAKRVQVTAPGEEKPLYGVFALLPVAQTATTVPPKRTYRVAIPGERVAQAKGGLISVIYQPYQYTFPALPEDAAGGSRGALETTSGDQPSWVLWLSDTPF